ncbi:MAG: UDP-3-O-acyl-N-acetylglucosamine deacetylase [Acidobacteria bacterium]|nr:UDP-3-O-acyl-N-acetylglucosamine deacetylase [Acidobacteriota bacterium]
MKLPRQTTVGRSISVAGIGLHTGCRVNLALSPAPSDTGIVFRRTDLDHFPIEAQEKHVARVSYATTLMKRGVMISTVEHLLGTLYALQLDNAYVDLDSLEVPILDGSGAPFVDMVRAAGIEEQQEPKRFLTLRDPIVIRSSGRSIRAVPSLQFKITYHIDFPHPLIRRQSLALEVTPERFAGQIAPARTFGFYHEVEGMRRNGLARGGSLENALVLDEKGLLNGQRLRFADEFVRHKILDLLGDLALIGRPLRAHILAEKAGHSLHTHLASRILASVDSRRRDEP